MAEKIVVPFSDDHDEAVTDDQLITDDEPAKAGESAADRESRLERRRERAKAREAERKQEREELQRLRGEVGELRGRMSALSVPAQQAPQKDPYKERLDGIYAEQKEEYTKYHAELAAHKGDLPASRIEYYERRSREIEERKATALAEAAVARTQAGADQRSARQVWVQKYPDVYNNPRAYEYAEATAKRRQAISGDQLSNDDIDEIMSETMTTFRLGKQKPTPRERERMSGISSGGTGGGAEQPNGGIQITSDIRKMAVALHPELKEEEAVKKWVNTVGRTLRKEKVL